MRKTNLDAKPFRGKEGPMVPRTRKTTGTRTGIGWGNSPTRNAAIWSAKRRTQLRAETRRNNQKRTALHETPKEIESYHGHPASPLSTGNLREQNSPKEEAVTHRETEEMTYVMPNRIQGAAMRGFLNNESGANDISVLSSVAGANMIREI